ncbi:MAG: type I CRISPR-associated protein Cas7 [candidate division Zixibacteria bacterium]|nr:type I CRISPR-associated protein Cas7 [candidate division Zixibacteria bacterium]
MPNIKNADEVKRASGLLIIEVINSNPNGDPDRESDPRQRPDERGKISPVSFKRKLRDLVQPDITDTKRTPVWDAISRTFTPVLSPDDYWILESRSRERKKIEKELADNTFVSKYWDGRLFGNTFLEEGASNYIKTGVVQVGMGVSVSPVFIERDTNTNKAGVQEGKTRGMAPLGSRYVQHGVYTMPFFVNPSAASRSGCKQVDVDLMLKLIPYAYSHNLSTARPFVGIRHAWYMEHKSPLGSCSDFSLIEKLTPRRKGDDSEKPSTSWSDYHVPTDVGELRTKLADFRDLMLQVGEDA